jgi:aminopeptidase N
MQIDLYANMKIDRIMYKNKELTFTRDENAVFIRFPEVVREKGEIIVYYGGIPQTPNWNIPMNGGVLWDKDDDGNSWAQVVCQGSGASLWWPNKDHLSDEPDSMKIWITVPDKYTEISNGRLQGKKPLSGNRMRYEWYVSYPINNYNVTFNIGKYTHWRDYYVTDDTLTIDYYVMPYNRARADTMFQQTKPMIAGFEKYFGKYPFSRDGFTLVETIYPMEHQSGVCLGKITVENATSHNPLLWHESAHEWWGNAISCTDMADMWFHEAFATYAESLLIEREFGKEQAEHFLRSQLVSNKYPIVGVKEVNHIFYDIGDMYSKGSIVLHTLRNAIDNDSVWFDLLPAIQNEFRYKTLTSDQLVDFINQFTGKDRTSFFDHYLKNVTLPVFRFRLEKKGKDLVLHYRWDKVDEGFKMPMRVTVALDRYALIHPSIEWQKMSISNLNVADFGVDEDGFLVEVVEE